MKIMQHQVRALKIYKAINRAKLEAVDNLKKQGFFDNLEKSYEKILKESLIDTETARTLKYIFYNAKTDNANIQLDSSALNILDMVIKMLEISEKVNKAGNKTCIQIFLSDDGELSRDPWEKFNYSMKNSSQRFKILQTLNNDYIETSKIRDKVVAKSSVAIRKDINTLNSKISYSLKLNKPLIESKSGSGYRINERYELIKG